MPRGARRCVAEAKRDGEPTPWPVAMRVPPGEYRIGLRLLVASHLQMVLQVNVEAGHL